MSVSEGDAFLLDTPPSGKHLYIAIAELPNGKFLCVNVTTRRANSEMTCVITPTDPDAHDFIGHESVIAYKWARELDPVTIPRLISSGVMYLKKAVDPVLLERIQRGGVESRRLKNKYRTFLREYIDRVYGNAD